MRLPALTTAFLAPLCARAFVNFTNNAFTGITVGHAFNLTWHGDGTPVTITLMNGPTSSLAKVSVVASTSDFPLSMFARMSFDAHLASAIGASYTWTPPSTLAPGTYALEICQSGSTNYSPQFSIAGGTGTSASSYSQNVAVPSPTYPILSSFPTLASYPPPTSHPATGTWAAFTALAAVVSLPPIPTGNGSGSAMAPPSVTGSTLHPSYVRNSTILPSRADRRSATGLAVVALAAAVGFAIIA